MARRYEPSDLSALVGGITFLNLIKSTLLYRAACLVYLQINTCIQSVLTPGFLRALSLSCSTALR